jgi:four helix bundle protein
MTDSNNLVPKHGGYRSLKSFQIAQLIYDVTIRFCDRYINPRSRTHDQMVQAARSGVQNIAEGSKASGTSKKTELKLTNVARASLEELRLDYEDFLRQRGLHLWSRDDPRRTDLIARRLASGCGKCIQVMDNMDCMDTMDKLPTRKLRLTLLYHFWLLPAACSIDNYQPRQKISSNREDSQNASTKSENQHETTPIIPVDNYNSASKKAHTQLSKSTQFMSSMQSMSSM